MTVDDPDDLDAAVDVRDAADAERRERIMEYACHEGNRAMENILSAARAEEEARQEGPQVVDQPGADGRGRRALEAGRFVNARLA